MNTAHHLPNRTPTERWPSALATGLFLAAALIGAGAANGQSFDCRNARSADELTICQESGLAKLDQELSSLQRPRKEMGMQLHWDGNNDSVRERNRSAAFGTGAFPPSLDRRSIRRLEESGHWLPEGLEYHVAFRSNGNLRVSEIWGSRTQFDAFGKHLMPLLKDEGIELRGDPEMLEIHNIVQR